MGNGKRKMGNGKWEKWPDERTRPEYVCSVSHSHPEIPDSRFPIPDSQFPKTHTPFTSPTSFVIEVLASPNSIDVLGL